MPTKIEIINRGCSIYVSPYVEGVGGVVPPIVPPIIFGDKISLVRNKELDKTLSLASSSKLAITTKDGQVLTIDNLPDYSYFDQVGWVAMLCDADKTNTSDPDVSGDYLFKNFCTVDRAAKTLTFAAGVDLSAWEVADNLVLYHALLNYSFVGNQISNPLFSITGAPAWRSLQSGVGPMFRHSDGRFIWLFIGFQASPTTGRIGYAYSYDMITWIVGNGDAPIFLPTSLPDCYTINLTGNCYPVEGSPGNYWCLVFYSQVSDAHCVHRILYFNENFTSFSYSPVLMTDRELGFAGGAVFKQGSYYHLIYCLLTVAGVPYRSINAAKSLNLEGPYIDYQTDIVVGYGSNDGVPWSYCVDAPGVFDDGVNIFGVFGAQSQWAGSGTKGNRQYCLLDFDKIRNVWSVNKNGLIFINPLYYQDLNGTYDWAGDHCGGYPSFFMEGEDMYMTLTMKGGFYQATMIKLIK